MKNLDIRYKDCSFAAYKPSTLYRLEIAVAIFMSDLLLSAKIRGYRFYNGLLHSCCNLYLAVRGAIAFLIFSILIFCYMPSTTKKRNAVKDSICNSAQTERNTVSIEAFNIEKDAKNQAYYFILSKGLLDSFAEFCKIYHSDNPHQDCINYLAAQL